MLMKITLYLKIMTFLKMELGEGGQILLSHLLKSVMDGQKIGLCQMF